MYLLKGQIEIDWKADNIQCEYMII